MPERVVITAAGAVSSAGLGAPSLLAVYAKGGHALGWITRFEVPDGAPTLAAEVEDFDLEEILGSRKAYLDPVAKYYLAACAMALESLELGQGEAPLDDVGIVCGSAFGPLDSVAGFEERLAEKGPRYANPVLFNHTYVNAAASLAAIEWGLRGPNLTLCTGWTSGLTALQTGADLIRLGRARCVLAGGADALSQLTYLGLAASRPVTREPEPELWNASDGIVPGEGACALALETERSALERGVEPLAELVTVAVRSGDLEQAVEGVLRECFEAADGPVAGYFGAHSGVPDVLDAEVEALDRLGLADADTPYIPLARLIGETFAASGPLYLTAAIGMLRPGGQAVVANVDPAGHAAAALVRVLGDADEDEDDDD